MFLELFEFKARSQPNVYDQMENFNEMEKVSGMTIPSFNFDKQYRMKPNFSTLI